MPPHARTVLVTGGSSGIGARLVGELADRGDRVVVLDRDRPADDRVRFVAGDVRSAADHQRAVEAAVDDDGRLDVLVANAGVHDGGLTFGSDLGALESDFRRVLDINLTGYLLALGAAARPLAAARGCAVLTLSDASFDVVGNGAGLAYAAAKHGALGLLKVAARELGPAVRVNAVAPGGVATAMSVESAAGERTPLIADADQLAAKLAGRTVLGRGVTIDEVVAAYLFLSSEQAAGITGQVLRVDAGRLS
ncbi:MULTISPECIES: SDR family NAD(P)-dependent oxidoreductase [unclassified Nocardioides]|uniref:SDR family NAD(P)-dependent oxidoreductase n=1 Tax=unclassified Nocardioides TaxID=2615069 RepID=UPI003608300D